MSKNSFKQRTEALKSWIQHMRKNGSKNINKKTFKENN